MSFFNRLSLKLSTALGLFCLVALPAVAAPQYTIQDLGTLRPNGSARAQGINQAGQIYGTASFSTTTLIMPDHVFFWSPQGGMIDIGALPDTFSNPGQGARTATGMNNAGQIAGASLVANVTLASGVSITVNHVFLWTPAPDGKSGVIQDLGKLGLSSDTNASTSVVALNDRGQVIGLDSPPYSAAHGFLWTPGGTDGVAFNPQMKDLGLFQPSLLDATGRVVGLLNGVVTLYDGHNFVSLGDPVGFDPNGLNTGYRFTFLRLDAQGDIYGNYATPTVSVNPFVWIPSQPGGTTGRFVEGIHANNSATPPGALTDAELPPDAQIFSATESVFAFDPSSDVLSAVDLGGLLFDTFEFGNPNFPLFETYVLGQNRAGDLVGYCYDPTNGKNAAFLEHAGLMYDPNLHVQGASAGAYHLSEADGINDAGQIAATGLPIGGPIGVSSRAVLLTPAGQAAPVAPTVQLIQPQSPDAGDPDQTVDIVGTGFQVGAVVAYDGAPLTANIYAETQSIAHIPSTLLTAGTHTITVTNPGGQSGSGSYVVLPVRPIAIVASVAPLTLPAGSPDTAITLTGTGLYPETEISYGYSVLNDTPLTVLSASADHTQITVLVPASVMTSGTTLTFYAYTPGQRGSTASPPAPVLTIVNPAPTITSITPASLPADSVSTFVLTVNGTNFVPGTSIYWNEQYFSTTFVSSTQVTANIYEYNLNYLSPDMLPPGPVTVSVVNAAPGGGTASTTQTITNGPYPAPVLTGITPSVIAASASFYSLTLTGSGFLHHSILYIGSQAFSFAALGATLSADRTQASFSLPPSAVPPVGVYPVIIVNPGPGGGTSGARLLAVQGASLRVSKATLTRNPANGQIIVQVTLTNGGGADASGALLTQATLRGIAASGLPIGVGTVPAYGSTTVTLTFPATIAFSHTRAALRISGQYGGGSFFSSRMVLIP